MAGVQVGDPSALPYLSDHYIVLPEPLDHHYLDIIHPMVVGTEVCRDRLLSAFDPYVRPVTVHSFTESLFSFSAILGTAPSAAEEINDVGGPAGGMAGDSVAGAGTVAGKGVGSNQHGASLAPRSTTWNISGGSSRGGC